MSLPLRTRCALPTHLLPCPKGIDPKLTSFSALEAWQIHNERFSYGGASGAWRIPTPGLFWKYEKMNRQLFNLSFPERATNSASLPLIHNLLEAIEPFIRLCFDLDDIKTGAMPAHVLEGLYSYMRINNISLSSFGLEDAKTANAFKGYQYGVRDFESLPVKFKVLRRMHREFNGKLDMLKDAWILCMDDLALYIMANSDLPIHEAFHQTWGDDLTDVRDSLVEKFGTGGTIAEFQKFAAANSNTASDASSGAGSTEDPMSISPEANQIKKDESGDKFQEKVYLDTKGKRTIGYGFNMDDPAARGIMNSVGIQNYDKLLSGKDKLTQAEADRLFVIKLKEAVADAIKFLGPDTWSKLDSERQGVIVNMSYQLGYTRLSGFPALKEALENGNYLRAAGEIVTGKNGDASDLAQTSPKRANRLLIRMMGPAPSPP